MLISFTVENVLSFKEKTHFSMVASREKQHVQRLPHLKGYMRLLPTAAVYGGNASGKTNFFKAINFAKHTIVMGTQPDARIPVEPFRLDVESRTNSSTFIFEFFVDGKCYEYGFSLTAARVIEEWLVEILKTTEKNLFHRKEDSIEFYGVLEKDKRFQFLFEGTRENQLFLTNAVSQKNEKFRALYLWFRDKLVLVAPDSRFESFDQFLRKDSPLHELMNRALSRLDTGVSRLGGEKISFDNLPFPSDLLSRIKEDLVSDRIMRIRIDETGDRYVITVKDGEIVAEKMVSYHLDSNDEEVKFELRHESDGTLRIIDLLPLFLAITHPEDHKVYIIDELDRSLHSLLTRQLLENYLTRCSHASRSQLLFTTHDMLLMDQKLLRRDEMWVVERDQHGRSELIGLSEYKEIRNDKDIRKSYLQGRLGGVPRILMVDSAAPSEYVVQQ